MPHPLKFQPVAMAADEQSAVVGGHKFRAQHGGEPGRCTGCDFKDGFGCAFYRVDLGSSLCQPQNRQDGKGVVWVPAVTKRP